MNNTLSKEEILDEHMDWDRTRESIYVAMDEYAKQEAIGLADFCSERYHGIRGDKGWMMVDSPFTKYTDDEVYEQYLLHKQNKGQ